MENHELSRAELLLHASSTNGEVPTQKKLAFPDAMSNRLFLYPIDKWSQIKYKIIRMPFYFDAHFFPYTRLTSDQSVQRFIFIRPSSVTVAMQEWSAAEWWKLR